MDTRILNIVDEVGNTVRQATREDIHQQGLLHAEINVWFYTHDGKIIFQHRAKDKDTYPNLLDATVGGHVEIGNTYEQAAITETREETGVQIDPKDLVLLCVTVTKSFDEATGRTNHARRNVYVYRYTGSIADLQVEEGKAIGFEAWPIDTLLNLPISDNSRFISTIFDAEGINIIKKIKALV